VLLKEKREGHPRRQRPPAKLVGGEDVEEEIEAGGGGVEFGKGFSGGGWWRC